MKKRIFCLIIGLCCMLSTLTGCNLFGTDLEKYYNTIVAKAGGYELTKDELVNGYYNYGQKLVSEQGYTVEKAMEETMQMLLQRKMLVGYAKAEAKKEEQNTSLTAEDYVFALTNTEYNDAIRETWDFVDSSIKELVIKEYDDPDTIFTESEKATPELAGSKNAFEKTIILEDDGRIRLAYGENYVKNDEGEYVFEDEDEKLSLYDYTKPTFIEQDIIEEVWKDYIESLKEGESYKNHKNKSDKAVFNRELDRVFKTSLENAYLSKLQNSYTRTFGTEDGYLTGATTQKIIDEYNAMYAANVEEFSIDPKTFYTNITGTSNRGDYVYYGTSEDIIEVQHILVKFANDESSFTSDPLLSEEENAKKKEDLNTIFNTYAKERDSEGFETGNKVSVYDLRNTIIKNIVDTANGSFVAGSSEYAEYVTREFNKLIYKYNEDGGIMNAQFDYAIGANGTSSMVEEFTNAAIDLYKTGVVGSVSDIIESSYGYHILIYTNKLTNVDPAIVDIEMLASMKLSTTTSADDNMLEYIYGKIKQEAYSTYEANLLNTLQAGKAFTYYKANYKDLLE